MMDTEAESSESALFPGYKNIEQYTQDVLKNILLCNRAAAGIPSAGNEYELYSTFDVFCNIMSVEGKSIIQIMTELAQTQGARQPFQDLELDEKFDTLIDVNDMLLENVGSLLDEAAGYKKPETELFLTTKRIIPINASWNKKINSSLSPQSYSLLSAKNITRPQLSFKDKIDNSNTAFAPIIKEKPNSIKPLSILLEKIGDKEEYSHPYEWEIERFKPSEEDLRCGEPTLPRSLDETPLIHVKKEQQLIDLCNELKQQKEFAVDIEHHSYRTFQGIACLIQISTREKDFIVDALELRSHLYMLNEAFTDPKIVKVLHGADMDVLWLQRDFGVYIVNLFDTGQAARVLNFPHFSLAYLLKHYCKIDLNKKFQLADWRIRPLPSEMIKYAREDTHYLLYIYDCMKNDLLKSGNELKNLLHAVFQRSKEICLKKYEKPLFVEDMYLELYKRSQKMFNARQLFCLKELCAWRDKIAREEDESYGFVLPNHMMLQISEVLPREQQGILACCNPIPVMLKQRLNEIHSIITEANKHSLTEFFYTSAQNSNQIQQINDIDLNSVLHCPHDMHHYERQKTVPSSVADKYSVPLKKTSSLFIYDEPKSNLDGKNESSNVLPTKVADSIKGIVNPYQRYVLTLKYRSINETEEDNDDNETVNNPGSQKYEKRSKSFIAKEKDGNKQAPMDSSVEIIDTASPVAKKKSPNKNIQGEKTKNAAKVNTNSGNDRSIEIIDIESPVQREPCSESIKEKKKKKRKKQTKEPDILLSSTPKNTDTALKKCKFGEGFSSQTFKPFDYSETDVSLFQGRRKSKNVFNPDNEPKDRNVFQKSREWQKSCEWRKRKKQNKQQVFSNKKTKDGIMEWPKK